MKKLNNLTKILCALLMMVATFGTSLMHVQAAPEKTISLGDPHSVGTYIAGVHFTTKEMTNGELLYCLTMHKNTAKNTKATFVKERNRAIAEIIKKGQNITGNKDKDYYITQTAVWWYLDKHEGGNNLGEAFKEYGSDSYNLRHYVKELVAHGEKYKDKAYPTTSFELKADSTSMELKDGYYVSKAIKGTNMSNVSSMKVTLKDAPTGTIIVDANGKQKDTFGANEAFYVKVPSKNVTSTSMNITVNAQATGYIYKVYEYKPTSDNMQHVGRFVKEPVTVNKQVTLDIASSKVTVVKYDNATNQPLAGAKLVLKDSNGKVITSWTSTVNGHIIRNLNPGTYTVEETEAPEGYTVNKKPTTFTVENEKYDVLVKIGNSAKKVAVSIIKLDESTKQPLAGAVLQVTNAKGEKVAEFTTTTDAYVLTDLPFGTYTVSEISAPSGYMKSNEVVTFTIDEEHQSHQINFLNTPEVVVPDTADNSLLFLVLGIVIISMGIGFVYKNGQKVRR